MNVERRNSTDIDPRRYAASVIALLSEEPRRYRNFGIYWFFIKELLKRYYDRNNLYMLGDYTDPSVIERMPAGVSAVDTLKAAADEYQHNASFNLGRQVVEDDDGETFMLFDEDAGI